MKNESTLQPVSRIAKAHERNAARQMGEMLRREAEHQTQLETLVNYRNEYFENLSNAGKTGISSVQMQDYQVFLSRLDGAISQQMKQLEETQRSCQQSRRYWQSKHNHSEMIDRVIETRKETETNRKQAGEQRETDDRNAACFTDKTL